MKHGIRLAMKKGLNKAGNRWGGFKGAPGHGERVKQGIKESIAERKLTGELNKAGKLWGNSGPRGWHW